MRKLIKNILNGVAKIPELKFMIMFDICFNKTTFLFCFQNIHQSFYQKFLFKYKVDYLFYAS